mmetsp:Transcript_105958/g.306571  ORF Transcript_105958/g.306571 Transcript_105958/m.306571 type:complete len:638 (-) Transcript_105958:72-1985(-)
MADETDDDVEVPNKGKEAWAKVTEEVAQEMAVEEGAAGGGRDRGAGCAGCAGTAATTASDSTPAADAAAASSSSASAAERLRGTVSGRLISSRMAAAAGEIASALVLHDAERSTPRDALVYLGQSMAFAAACAVFPCYAAWCMGTFGHQVGMSFFGDDAQGEPAVYREGRLPTESLFQESHHIEHLAATPYGPDRNVEFGATLPGSMTTPLWRSAYLIYVLGAIVPAAFTSGSLFRLTARATVGYAAVVLGFIVAWTDAIIKLFAYCGEHGTLGGADELRAAMYSIGVFSCLLTFVLPVFGSSCPMSVTVKCKAAGAMFLLTFVMGIFLELYQETILVNFFDANDLVTKLLIRAVGHVVFKKIVLEISWRLIRYLHKIGAVEGNDRAYLMYAPLLVYLTMNGRMMQTSSDTVELAVALELFAIIAEVFEARDLLRSNTPLKKSKETVRYIVRQLLLQLGSSRINIAEGSGDGEGPGASEAGQAVEAEAEEEGFDDTDLRREFCARVLIATQLAEAVSIFAATALVLASPPMSFGPTGTPPISDGVLWSNFAVMLIGEITWKTQDKVAATALFVALAVQPGVVLINAPINLCFTSSERLYGGGWELPDFSDYMLSRCPTPYGLDNPAGLYPNATAGRW